MELKEKLKKKKLARPNQAKPIAEERNCKQ